LCEIRTDGLSALPHVKRAVSIRRQYEKQRLPTLSC
jgi:hypothetical protein